MAELLVFFWSLFCWDRDYLHWIQLLEVLPFRTSFTLGEPVSLVKVFRLFRLKRIVLVLRVWTQ